VSFEYQPVLASALVELRPLLATDYSSLFAAAADPLIWEQHPVRNRHEREPFAEYFRDAVASGGALAVVDATTHAMIGASRFHAYDEQRSEVEIGWTFLVRSHWGGTYNAEIKRLMLQHAFAFVNSVIFLIGVTNHRSQRAVEKIGAVRVGTRPDASGRESYVYQILNAL
jgi:RimJ/RimL family protein N-acetyltransferase